MKSHLDYSVTIPCPPSHVFDWLTDFSKWPKWAVGIRRMEKVTPGPLAVGSQVREIWTGAGENDSQIWEISQWVPNDVLEMRSSASLASARSYFRLEPTRSGTRLAVKMELQTEGLLVLIGLVFRFTAKSQLRKFASLVEADCAQ